MSDPDPCRGGGRVPIAITATRGGAGRGGASCLTAPGELRGSISAGLGGTAASKRWESGRVSCSVNISNSEVDREGGRK